MHTRAAVRRLSRASAAGGETVVAFSIIFSSFKDSSSNFHLSLLNFHASHGHVGRRRGRWLRECGNSEITDRKLFHKAWPKISRSTFLEMQGENSKSSTSMHCSRCAMDVLSLVLSRKRINPIKCQRASTIFGAEMQQPTRAPMSRGVRVRRRTHYTRNNRALNAPPHEIS